MILCKLYSLESFFLEMFFIHTILNISPLSLMVTYFTYIRSLINDVLQYFMCLPKVNLCLWIFLLHALFRRHYADYFSLRTSSQLHAVINLQENRRQFHSFLSFINNSKKVFEGIVWSQICIIKKRTKLKRIQILLLLMLALVFIKYRKKT